MRVAIYCRVSTTEQNDQIQFEELQALCARSGWTLIRIYREKISGTKSIDQRAALKQMLTDARCRNFEMVIVWSVDRLGRSMQHLVSVLAELQACGVQLLSLRQGIDTSTPMGAMLWQFLGIFAEFEHSIRKERQIAGIARAKARGVRFGRPSISKEKERQIFELRQKGLGINRIAKTLRVGSGTVAKMLNRSLAELPALPQLAEC